MASMNPWTRLANRPPYALEEDLPWIRRFNDRVSAEHRLQLESLPEPFCGDVASAPVVLLGLNPGHDHSDTWWFNENDAFVQAVRGNLVHRDADYPLYWLDPRFADFGGSIWWKRALGPLIAECGVERVATRVAVVEWYPYHSCTFHPESPRSSSEPYTWSLARRAATDPARLVIVLRGAGSGAACWARSRGACRLGTRAGSP